MLSKPIIIVGTFMLLLILIFSGFYLYKAPTGDLKEADKELWEPPPQGKASADAETNKGAAEPAVRLVAGKSISLERGVIEVKGRDLVLKPSAASAEVPDKKISDMIPASPSDFVGVSITNTTGQILSGSSLGDEKQGRQGEMIVVENMGRPQGVDFRPRPVKAMAQQGLESEELKILEEKRRKRKSNFAKSLEKRELRQALYKHRN